MNTQYNKEEQQMISREVQTYGYSINLFEATPYLPSLAHTVGLFQTYNHPEIVCFGLSDSMLQHLLSAVSERVKLGETMQVGQTYEGFIQDYDIRFIEVAKDRVPDYLGHIITYYKTIDTPVLQLIWPDMEHHMPDSADFNPEWKFRQPLLDRNIDFRFLEERNVGVFTTSDVVDGSSPVRYVSHDCYTEWHFYPSENPDPDTIRLVSLESLVGIDDTLNQLFFLEFGCLATRQSLDDDWDIDTSGWVETPVSFD